MLKTYVVSGDSMQPTLYEGDLVLAVRMPKRWIRPGMIAFINVSRDLIVVKRIRALIDSKVELSSDNDQSISQYNGTRQTFDRVCAVMVCKLKSGFHRRATAQ